MDGGAIGILPILKILMGDKINLIFIDFSVVVKVSILNIIKLFYQK